MRAPHASRLPCCYLLFASYCSVNVAVHAGGVISPQLSEILWVRLGLPIPSIHLFDFLGRDLRQVPDEQNQASGFRGGMHLAEGRHAAQANSIGDCVVDFAIALVLRASYTQVGRFRIEALADYRLAAAVIRMAGGAVIREMLHACPNILG